MTNLRICGQPIRLVLLWAFRTVAIPMRVILAIFTATLLVSCAMSKPLPPQQSSRILGSDVFGLVLRITDGVSEDVEKSTACLKRDALCLQALYEAAYSRYATVQLYGSVVFLKTLIPRNYQVDTGDIVKIHVPAHENDLPVVSSVGAKRWERGSTCDWVDGTPSSLRGGVNCKGWSYKSITGDN